MQRMPPLQDQPFSRGVKNKMFRRLPCSQNIKTESVWKVIYVQLPVCNSFVVSLCRFSFMTNILTSILKL